MLFSRRGAPITCAWALWLTLIGLSRSQNIHVDWSGGKPHLPHLEEGQRAVGRYDDEDEPAATATVMASVDAHAYTGASWPGYTPPSPPAAAASEDLEDAPHADARSGFILLYVTCNPAPRPGVTSPSGAIASKDKGQSHECDGFTAPLKQLSCEGP